MNERDYYQQWQTQAAGQQPFQMALAGGQVASSPGQIFMAGYQAAVRQTFPELQAALWYSFAVSEDRGPDSVRPGVHLTGKAESGFEVHGFKTWIVGLDHVDQLVLKVGSGEEAAYGCVDARDPGVTLHGRESKFLADMSQGSAEFTGASFTPLKDASGVADFRRHEPYYLYIAFLGYLQANHVDSAGIAATLERQSSAVDLQQLDLEVTRLLDLMAIEGREIGEQWFADQKLFTMYSKSIQSAPVI